MRLDDYKDKIIEMYTKQEMTTTSIAKELGCSSSGVGRLLIRNGIQPHHTPNEMPFKAEQFDDISKKYTDGMTSTELAEEYGVSDKTIVKVLRMNGVEIRKAARRSKVKNHDYFDDIDSAVKAYFLGWMISDGSVVESNTRPDRAKVISLEIQSADIDILKLFAKELDADSDIVKSFDKRGHSYIRFTSAHMAESLAAYGIVPRKTWHSYLPNIKEEYIPHLIRGYFDGNGTVTANKTTAGDTYIRFAFYGSEIICEQINQKLHEQINTPLHKVSKGTCFHVWFGGNKQAVNFYNYIYKDCGEFYLKRKRAKFIELLSSGIQQGNTEVIQGIA